MSWDERQRAMLAEMGLRVWGPLPTALPAEAAQAAESAEAVLPAAVRPSAAAGAAGTAICEPDDRLSAVARMDWDELRRSAADCRACAMCGGRSNSVFSDGSVRAQWLFVGEAPGEQEDALGLPFAGQAAQLLANMLRAIDLSLDTAAPPARQAYLSSALKCRPPLGSPPGRPELQQCRPYLERQIELLKPRIIVAMGRLAVLSLLGSNEPLGRLRGRVHEYRGIPVIVSFPPDYLLRTPADKARAWEDLCLARATLQGMAGV